MVVQLKQGVIFNNLGLWTPMLGHYRYMVSAWPQPKKHISDASQPVPALTLSNQTRALFLFWGWRFRFRHKNPTIPAVFCHGAIPVIPVVDENIKAWSFLGNLGSTHPTGGPASDAGLWKISTRMKLRVFCPPIWTKIVERKSSVKNGNWFLHLPPKFSGVKIIIYLSCHRLD